MVDPFDWRATKDGQVLVSRGGRVVTTVRGPAVTGNYKRGTERG